MAKANLENIEAAVEETVEEVKDKVAEEMTFLGKWDRKIMEGKKAKADKKANRKQAKEEKAAKKEETSKEKKKFNPIPALVTIGTFASGIATGITFDRKVLTKHSEDGSEVEVFEFPPVSSENNGDAADA